jgi:nucleoside-diphosphate-sugar epimerase
MANSYWLVTGGAGFIGSHLVQELVRRDQQVRVVDDLSSGLRENVPSGVELVEGDLADPKVARQAVRGCSVVLHQAARPSVPRSVQDPVGSNHANVTATLELLVAAREAGIGRLVFAGSSSVYGNAAALPKHEDMPAEPLSPYALQKLVSERYCQMFTRLYGFETVTTRYFNVFGPRQQPGSPYSGVISLFIEALVQGRSPLVLGDGQQTRDFTYVGDVVAGVLAAAEAPGVAGEVINIAAGGRISLLDLVHTLQRILDSRVEPTFGPTRDGDVRDSQADITKA